MRYSRHLSLPEVGINGQKKIKAAKVLVIGAGGLGSPSAVYLALAGVGTIGRVETVEEFIHHHAESSSDCQGLHDDELMICGIEEEKERGTKFTVFDGDGVLRFIPLGRGEDTKVTVANLMSEDHGSGSEIHDIEEGKVHTLPDAPKGQPTKYDRLRGKEAGLLVPFVRGANTDLNTTLAIALVAMLTIQYWGFRTLGLRGYGGKFINIRQGPIFFAVGLLEIISEISRVISFTFRLFGNMFAGEILLVAMAFLFPLIGIIPFLGLELFVGFIQAFIFAMLTLVFAVVATAAHGEEGH